MSTEPIPSAPQTSKSFFQVLWSESFLEKALLLVLTAVLSGIVIPLVIKSIDRTREGREALSRSQVKLFEDVSETILTAETLMLDVSWFGTDLAKNGEMQRKALERYTERSVDLIAKWRVQTTRAQTLASPKVAEKLDAFLKRFFFEQDTPMNQLWNKCGVKCDWNPQHQKNEAMLGEANALIIELANDLGLRRK